MSFSKFTRAALIVAAGMMFSAATPAMAQTFIGGTVNRVTPSGVYMTTPSGVTFVPRNSATFRWGNSALNWGQLTPGRRINAYYNRGWQPTYVPDAYYRQHPDWDWNRHTRGWNNDRRNWKKDRGGRWYR